MGPEDFQALSSRRAARADLLSKHHTASGEALRFYRSVVSFQGEIFPQLGDWQSLLAFRRPLVEMLQDCAPEPLREAALGLDDESCRAALEAYWEQRDTTSVSGFLARVLLQPYAARCDFPDRVGPENLCPRCGHRPQVGVLRPHAQGTALSLRCSLCPDEWPFRIGRCAGCGEESREKFAYYTTPDLGHLRVHACDTCRRYHHTVDLGVDPAALSEVDELTAMPLDVWAQERGYRKLQPNLAGI